MKASSGFPVLDNRPIDQWKVTELKEELKRRKLTTRGLKEELVRRLDEALRVEMEVEEEEGEEAAPVGSEMGAAEEEVDNGVQDPKPDNVEMMGKKEDDNDGVEAPKDDDIGEAAVAEQPGKEFSELGVGNPGNAEENVGDADYGVTKLDAESVLVDSEKSVEQPIEGRGHEEQELGLVSDQPPEVGDVLATSDAPIAGVDKIDSEVLLAENAGDGERLQHGDMERDNEGFKAQELPEDLKPLHEDGKLDSSDSNNQVSEVSSSIGFPIKSNSISTDSVYFNEKNDLKDNIIADNVKLESDVKPEMVQPSSSDIVPDGGKSHPSDVEEPQENKVFGQQTDNNVTNADVSQKNYSADLGSSEKLNLDRSSGDDSMEEDVLESKHIDSHYNSEEVVEKTEIKEITTVTEERPVATMDIDVPEKEIGTRHENNVVAAASTDKRKLSDQEPVLNNEPPKRQRRWKTESDNVKEPQISNISPQALVKDVPQPAVLRRNLAGSNSSSGANDPPKEREVPPSAKPATDSLRIDRFLRPFTLKAVQELLAKTGTVTSFWMDHIKTHCFVSYSSVEEATETRNAVFNLQWPPNGGRQLVAEFVDPEEVKSRLDSKTPPAPAAPASSGPTVTEPPPTMPQPSPRQQSLRQQMSQQPTLPPPPPLSNPPQAREWAGPPPPPQIEKVEAPIVTLDDLFRKTKATPRIYYLPLSEEKVSAVLEARRRNPKP